MLNFGYYMQGSGVRIWGRKKVGGLPGRGRRKASGVLGVAGKFNKWLVAATMTEARLRN
jgi:hypothetical protein